MSEKALEFKVKRLHRLNNGGSTAAFADVIVNDAMLIKGMRVVNGQKGIFVSMPQEKGRDDRWYDTVVCLSDDVKSDVSKCILEAYQSECTV